MAIPIINDWKKYFDDYDEGLGSSYERIIINNILADIVAKYEIKNVLEAPCFGFTGLSGINSAQLAVNNIDVTVADNKGERLNMIEEVWRSLNLPAKFIHSTDFTELPFEDNRFCMSWNFSALWFVKDLTLFLEELSRVTQKVILLMVPNRTGAGFIWQKLRSSLKKEQLDTSFYNQQWIRKSSFLPIMERLGWKLARHSLLDCPPWPDIGMKKEDFLKIFCLHHIVYTGEDKGERITIIDYYNGKDACFADKMLKYYWFERMLPSLLKLFWAHHHYYLFVRK